jgi:hypothetical protein
MEKTLELTKSPIDEKLDELETLILAKQSYVHSNVEHIGSLVGQLENTALTPKQLDKLEELEEKNELNMSSSGMRDF